MRASSTPRWRCYVIDHADPAHPKVLLGDKTKFLRQYYKFVRPGATRIEAASQVAAFDPLAFINPDGGYVVVVKCGAGGEFSIGGLAAGTYGIKYTTAGAFDVDLPDQTIDPGQPVLTAIPQAGVLTVYAKPTMFDQRAPFRPGESRRQRSIAIARDHVTWSASTDNIAVAGYRIYRDGAQVGFSPTTSFEDASGGSRSKLRLRGPGLRYGGQRIAPVAGADRGHAAIRTSAREVLGYWKFDEGQGGTAVDSSAYDHHGTIFGAAWAQGYIGQALDFDGADDYVQIQPADDPRQHGGPHDRRLDLSPRGRPLARPRQRRRRQASVLRGQQPDARRPDSL